jgi:hypothetical protein
MLKMFLEILAPIGPFVSLCIRILIHRSLGLRNKNTRIKPFLLALFVRPTQGKPDQIAYHSSQFLSVN